MKEPLAYFEKLRALHVPADERLALLALASDVEPDESDRCSA
jgi:hypothetical protein